MRPTTTTRADATRQAASHAAAGAIAWLFGMALCAALFLLIAYQIPATHTVDIGGRDAAYTQGFFDTERADVLNAPPYLAGSDGRARWSGASSFLVFPQIGLPAELSLRLRARPDQTAGDELIVLLNGATELGRITPTNEWQEYTFAVNGGLLKPSDVVIELRATTPGPISAEDGRVVGVLLDRAGLRTRAVPITPYPAQLALAAMAGAAVALVFKRRNVGVMVGFGVGLATVFLLLYRLQMPYSYPLRGLLVWVNLGLAAAVLLRYGPRLAHRAPALLDVAALGGIGVWLVALLAAAQNHVVLSRPGVETDFRVFALRSAQLTGVFQPTGVYDAASDGVLRADGFYNLGYPLLLWLVRPLTSDNPFLAARLIAAISGVVMLGAAWWLARRVVGRGPALVALLCLGFSPFVVQYGLYVGTDAPFTAACALTLALLIGSYIAKSKNIDPLPHPHPSPLPCGGEGIRPPLSAGEGWGEGINSSSLRYSIRARGIKREGDISGAAPPNPRLILFGAGVAAGAAFLFRHPGLLLLPFGWLVIALVEQRRNWRMPLLLFTLGFALAALPQFAVNIRDTSNPLYSQQAKNIWLAVYGNSDWANWGRAPNDIGLAEVVLADPPRFLGNWLGNIRGFLGAGGEDTTQFGRADQLRLLAFPANWLAVLALAWWLFGRRTPNADTREHLPQHLLLFFAALYIVGVSVGLGLLRFALPLVPIYALAAAWAVQSLAARTGARASQVLIGLLLAALLWPGFATGTGFVLGNQPADERAAVEMIQRYVVPPQRVHMQLDKRAQFDTYSAIAHLVAAPDEAATYELRKTDTAQDETPIESAGGYTLYQRTP